MILSKEIEDKIKTTHNPTIDLDGKKYYVKSGMIQFDGVELVVEELAKIVGVKSIKSERLLLDGIPYYLSEDLNGMEGKTFELAMCHILFGHTLNEMFDALQRFYPNNVIGLMDQIVKMFMFDALVMNQDRNYSNWGFLIDKHGLSDVVILDNDYAFVQNGSNGVPMSFNESSRTQRDDLFSFLESSSQIYTEMFREMYRILTPELVSDTFGLVEEDNNMNIPLKEIFLRNYNYNYKLIGEKLRGKNL
jgi:hypothetical protein